MGLGSSHDVLEGERGERERRLRLAAVPFPVLLCPLLPPPPPLRRPLGDGHRCLLGDKVQERVFVAGDGGGEQGGDGLACRLVGRGGGFEETPSGARSRKRRLRKTPTLRR